MNEKDSNICKFFIFIAGAAFFGYCIYFDRKYRSKNVKKLRGKDQNPSTQINDLIKSPEQNQIFDIATDTFPPQDTNFFEEIERGEDLIADGNYELGADHLKSALMFCDQPIILLEALEKELPEEAYDILVQKINNKKILNKTPKNERAKQKSNDRKSFFQKLGNFSLGSSNQQQQQSRKMFPDVNDKQSADYIKCLREIHFGHSLIIQGQLRRGILLVVNAILKCSCPDQIFKEMKTFMLPQHLNEIYRKYQSLVKQTNSNSIPDRVQKECNTTSTSDNNSKSQQYYWIEENEYIETTRCLQKSFVHDFSI